MVGAVALPPDELVDLLVCVDVRPRGQLLPPVRVEGGLGEDLPGELDTLPHLVPESDCQPAHTASLSPVLLRGEIVGLQQRSSTRV